MSNQFEELSKSTQYLIKWIGISIVLALCIGSASAGFLISLEWITNYREANTWLIYFLPIVGLLVGWIFYKYGKSIEGGNNLIIDNIHQPQKPKIPLLMAPLIYVGTIITHLFGGSAGREGTALQMAASIADQFSSPLKLNNEDRRMLLIAAVAGGFGSVFGTPIAGTIFALEFYFIGRIRYQALLPALCTAVFSDMVTKYWNANHTHYHIDIVPEINPQHILYAAIAGVCFGICAKLFSFGMHAAGNIFKSKISFPPLRTALGGFLILISFLLIGNTDFIGLGIPVIVSSFDSTLPIYVFAIKMVLTIITLSSGFKGGEVTPLFFIGATLGSALSGFMPLPTSLLAGMGFVAVFAGATNTPLACTIMAFELFGSESAIYVAIACCISFIISGNSSIYRNQIIGDSKTPKYSNHIGKKISDL